MFDGLLKMNNITVKNRFAQLLTIALTLLATTALASSDSDCGDSCGEQSWGSSDSFEESLCNHFREMYRQEDFMAVLDKMFEEERQAPAINMPTEACGENKEPTHWLNSIPQAVKESHIFPYLELQDIANLRLASREMCDGLKNLWGRLCEIISKRDSGEIKSLTSNLMGLAVLYRLPLLPINCNVEESEGNFYHKGNGSLRMWRLIERNFPVSDDPESDRFQRKFNLACLYYPKNVLKHFQYPANLGWNFFDIDVTPSCLWQLQGITHLNLDYNKLQYLPDRIVELTNLVELSLEVNELDHVPSSIGKLTKLCKLGLSSNIRLSTLPSCIGLLPALAEITLERTGINSLHTSFKREGLSLIDFNGEFEGGKL